MQQQTLSTFGVNKNVRTEKGRWVRDSSPQYVRHGFRCMTCGQRFKSMQGLGSHRKHAHPEEPEKHDKPHWAWHFLQGSQPHADGAEEPVVVGGAKEFATPEKERTNIDRRCGASHRVRYTTTQKLHLVDAYNFARENAMDVAEVVHHLVYCKKRGGGM